MRISDWSSDVCSSDLIAVELEEGDDRSRESDRTDRDTQAHFDAADGENLPRGIGDPERLRIEIGGRRHRDRGKADEAVERRDELRPRGHRDAARHDDTDEGTDPDGGPDFDLRAYVVRDASQTPAMGVTGAVDYGAT